MRALLCERADEDTIYERRQGKKGVILKNIAVIFGGKSQEHDISVITGVFTLNALDKTLFKAVPIYIGKDGVWRTGDNLFDVTVFRRGEIKGLKKVTLLCGENALYSVEKKLTKLAELAGAIICTHGRNGEDGTVAAVLKLSEIPFASPDVFASAFSMDKSLTRLCVRALGVKMAEGFTLERTKYYDDVAAALERVRRLGYPVIVKPSSSGSSIGITVVKDESSLKSAFDLAFGFDVKVVVEEFLDGAFDVNCACYRSQGKCIVSECERPSGGEFLSFYDKYFGSKGGEKRQFPADIDEKTSRKIKNITAEIYEKFCFSGIVRIDYLVCGGDVYLNEINSVPGSMAYYLFCEKISDFTALLTKLLNDAFIRWREYYQSSFAFQSNVLSLEGVNIKK